MVTLIAVGNKDGVQHRCDARCYNAKWEECTCICGGENHGKGLVQASNNTFDHAQAWIESAEHDNGEPFISVKIKAQARQLELFPNEPLNNAKRSLSTSTIAGIRE